MSDEFKTYRANAEGYDGDKIRVEGEVFTTNIPQGSWMDLLDDKGNVVERPKHKPAPGAGEVIGKGDAAAADEFARHHGLQRHRHHHVNQDVKAGFPVRHRQLGQCLQAGIDIKARLLPRRQCAWLLRPGFARGLDRFGLGLSGLGLFGQVLAG